MLKYREASSFPGKRYPLPWSALHIPDQALADPQVDGLSLRFRNSAFAFILAHELGHVYRGHPPFYKDVTLRQAKDHETQADHFALDLLRRAANIPMGATLFFQASAYWFPNRGDYATQQEWQTYLKERATHPLTAERLRLLARHMEASAADFSRNERDKRVGIEAVQFIARGIAQIATVLEDTELQLFMAKKSAQADLHSLRPRRQ
jgi:predicted Zn-dependent protease